jgi:hypothetical protein
VALVNVTPSPQTDLVTIEIGQDKDLWERKYRGADLKAIKDQFVEHQHEGYMHLGGSLDYILTFRNQFPKELSVNCLIELVNPAGAQANKALIKFSEVLKLGPNGSPQDTYIYRNDSVSFTKEDKPADKRVLKVTLTPVDPDLQPRDPATRSQSFEVTFSQDDINRYMDIEQRFEDNCRFHPGFKRCYVVTYRRRGDDRFTEPISSTEWECKIENDTRSVRAGWIGIKRGGDAVEFHHYHNEPAPNYKWTGRIEKELVEGESSNGWKKKP